MEVQVSDYGEWISGAGRWDLWFTGTFHYDATIATARRAVESLTNRYDPSRAAWAIESSEEWWKEGLGSNVHVHALLEIGEGNPPPAMVEEFWESAFGWAHVVKYDRGLGAGHYVSEYCMKDLLEDSSSWGFYSGPGEEVSDMLPF
jgi:hypothetical protein